VDWQEPLKLFSLPQCSLGVLAAKLIVKDLKKSPQSKQSIPSALDIWSSRDFGQLSLCLERFLMLSVCFRSSPGANAEEIYIFELVSEQDIIETAAFALVALG
jgi:hypothetical protein